MRPGPTSAECTSKKGPSCTGGAQTPFPQPHIGNRNTRIRSIFIVLNSILLLQSDSRAAHLRVRQLPAHGPRLAQHQRHQLPEPHPQPAHPPVLVRMRPCISFVHAGHGIGLVSWTLARQWPVFGSRRHRPQSERDWGLGLPPRPGVTQHLPAYQPQASRPFSSLPSLQRLLLGARLHLLPERSPEHRSGSRLPQHLPVPPERHRLRECGQLLRRRPHPGLRLRRRVRHPQRHLQLLRGL